MDGLNFHQWMLEQRLAALDSELEYWKNQTRANRQFKRHHFQVEAFSQIITDLRDTIDPEQDAVTDADDARERSRMVLALFRIWQFLRGKLVQRTDENLQTFLWLADEYAWLCYKPIFDAGLKQPPLVFLNGGYSPFTLTRKEGFEAESVPHELLSSQSLQDAMASLPFPVIGVPWYQVKSLADLPVIGHEVGHSVEVDLRLETQIRDAIAEAVTDKARQDRWIDWASEVFADIYGCLGCGAAFVRSLASFLSSESADAGGDKYPPPALRLRLNLDVLRSLGDAAGAESIANAWGASYVLPPEMLAYCNDAGKIAGAILDHMKTGETPIRSLIPFNDTRLFEIVENVVDPGPIPDGMPMRVLVAAYRLSYDRIIKENTAPESVNKKLTRLDRLQKAMEKLLSPDTRSGETPRAQAEKTRRNLAAQWLRQLK